MTAEDYARYRRQLEEQLRTDVELLYEAYRTKLRAYETVWRARRELAGEGDWQPGPPLAMSLPEPASGPALPPGAAAAPPVAPPAAPRPPRAKANQLYEDLLSALPWLEGPFDRNDIARVLGYEPRRSTLFSALTDLVNEGRIVDFALADGKKKAKYRRVDPKP